MNRIATRLLGAGLSAALCCFAAAIHAQKPAAPLPGGYPAKVVRVMVGTSPGGGVDGVGVGSWPGVGVGDGSGMGVAVTAAASPFAFACSDYPR